MEGQMDGWVTGVWVSVWGVPWVWHVHTAHVWIYHVWHVHTAHVWLYHVHFRTVKIDVYDWDRDGR